jgi:peptidoglycan L-alanyl-D-glutamate endopeptidase CwlK
MAISLNELLEKADKKLQGVHPLVAAKARQLVSLAFKEGIKVIVTQGLRTIKEQNELYAQGRTKPGKIVTNAKGGESYHNYGLAFDFALLNEDGSVNWNVDKKWHRVGTIGKSLGLEWGGEWEKGQKGGFVDYPHFQETFGLSLAELRAGKKPPIREGKNMDYKLTEEEEKMIAELKKLGITDGKNPERPVTQIYLWEVIYALINKIKEGKI